MVLFAHKPFGAINGSIWRKPTRFDLLKEMLFGWHLVHGGAYHPQHGHTIDMEYFPPNWLVWLRTRLATICR